MSRRVAILVGLIVGLTVWLGIVQWFTGFDEAAEFGKAQSFRAADLFARKADWSTLRVDANRDLGRFLPGYGFGGAVAVLAVFGARGLKPADRRLAATAMLFLALGAAADLVETVLFRSSLDRLIAGAAAADIDTRTQVTRAFTALKWAGLIAAALSLIWLAIRPDRPGRE